MKPPKRFRFGYRRWLSAVTLGVLLGACAYAIVERDAPELEKRYRLTEDLVLTDINSQIPGFTTGYKVVPHALTRAQFDLYIEAQRDSPPEGELTDRGTIPRASLVEVLVMFIGRSPGGDVRRAEVQFTDPVTGEKMTTYTVWDYILPTLEEVQ